MFREFTLSTLIREFMYFIPVITIVIFAIISDLISNLGKKENARAVSLFMLNIFTIGFCLLDKGYPYFGERFIFYYVGCFTPLMLVYSLYTLYRSIKHYTHFRRTFAIILLINAIFISFPFIGKYVYCLGNHKKISKKCHNIYLLYFNCFRDLLNYPINRRGT